MSHSENKKSRTTVEIYNRSYTIVGDEPAHRVKMVAGLVDQKMREIQEGNRSLDTSRLAVLTAVNTMNDYIALKESYNELLDKLKINEEKERKQDD
ncbi:cell division protein ZapA [Thalassobacillus cyri]|uniref:Cell division protein ZapA n=1 Tax=Thalassobacillus cyri TaxID=571932 RepID=A0A1H4BRZ9_9BACI|nr:cell division protein ZapA [Thalassobacillus cyri]SEA50879.1 cell division protein ZapA [Thalassobacillus cyri]